MSQSQSWSCRMGSWPILPIEILNTLCKTSLSYVLSQINKIRMEGDAAQTQNRQHHRRDIKAIGSNFKQAFQIIITENPMVIMIKKYPHLSKHSVLTKWHIFQYLFWISVLYVSLCLIFNNICFPLTQRLLFVLQTFIYDVVLEVIADIAILVVVALNAV